MENVKRKNSKSKVTNKILITEFVNNKNTFHITIHVVFVYKWRLSSLLHQKIKVFLKETKNAQK